MFYDQGGIDFFFNRFICSFFNIMIDMLSFDYGKVFISIDLWYKKNRINVYMYSVIRLRN